MFVTFFCFYFFFFFSSRRRHTRCGRDWSSDVCSSDLCNFWEGTLLILIFSGAQFLEHFAEGRSKREITKLLKMTPTTARLIGAGGNTRIVEVSGLKMGDRLQVLNGDQVPIDGVILSGTTSIDESSITGESIPREKSA